MAVLLLVPLCVLPVPNEALKYGIDTPLNNTDASFTAEKAGSHAGSSVAIAGDVNGDGYDDFLVGAQWFDLNPPSSREGKAYLFLGRPGGWTIGDNLTSSDASWYGEAKLDNAGYAVSGAGDVNGDGYDDILIAAPWNQMAGPGAGKVYVIFGRPTGWAKDVNLSVMANASFLGEMVMSAGGTAGYDLAGVGDVNADGFDDFLISSPNRYNPVNTSYGRVYLILGKASGWAQNVSLANADASFVAETIDDYLASSVSGAGDINGDGYDDMVISTHGNGIAAYNAGKVYILFGRPGWLPNQNISHEANATFLGGRVNDTAGSSVATGGDVNGDGYDDLVIGAPYNNELVNPGGKAYVIFGKPSGWAKDQNLTLASDASTRCGQQFGYYGASTTVSSDVDSDGFSDITIGAPSANGAGYWGRVFLYRGDTTGWAQNASTSTADASFTGPVPVSSSGTSVAGGGDINGDGNEDLVIGGPNYNSSEGLVHLVFPQLSKPPTSVTDVRAFDPTFANTVTNADIGDTIGVRLRGTDLNVSNRDATYVNVTSDSSPTGFRLRLFETGLATGEFHGIFSISNRTSEGLRTIKAVVDDQITITSVKDPSKYAIVSVTPGPVSLKPRNDVNITLEDALYNVTYWNSGSNAVSAWSFGTNASWLTLTSGGNNALLAGTPNNTHVGSYWVRINITDGIGHFAEHNFTLKVMNTPPNMTTESVNTTVQNQPYSVDHNSTDDGQGNITWHLQTNASWLRINTTTGVLNGTPIWNNTGVFAVNVSVDDGNGGWSNRSINLTVLNVNDAPFILNDDVTEAYEEQNYHVVYTAMDPDPMEMVTWMFSSNASWLNFDYTNHWLDGTPTNDHVGQYWVNVSAKDLNGGITVHNFTLTVINVNDEPVITSTPPTVAQVFYEYRYQVMVTDMDRGDILRYSLDAAPDNMTIGNVSGLVTWKPSRSQAGANHVIISVTDGNATVTQAFDITVTIPEFFVPVTTLLFPENDTIIDVRNPVLGWSSEDPDTERVYHNVYLSMDREAVGVLDPSARVAEDISQTVYVPKELLVRGNTYYWTIIPNDGVHGGTCNSGVWEFKVSLGAGISTEPVSVLNLPGNMSVLELHPVLLQWTGTSFMDDSIEYDVFAGRDKAKVASHDAATRIAEGLLNESIIYAPPSLGETYFWTVVPKDSGGSGKCLNGVWSFTLSPSARLNHMPVITSTPPTSVHANETYTYQVKATDADGDPLLYILFIFPDGMILDPITGLAMWTPTAAQVGKHDVLLWVMDDYLMAEQDFTIEVLPEVIKNEAPRFNSVPDIEAEVGKEYSYALNVTDADIGDVLTITIVEKPAGMVYNPTTGEFTWTPGSGQLGPQNVSIKVTDGKTTVYQNFTITVKEATGGGGTTGNMGMMPLLFLLVLAVVGVAAGTGLYIRNRNAKRRKAEEEAALAARTKAAAIAAAASYVPPPSPPLPVAAPAGQDEEVEPFEITDVFLIYNDGRLLAHSRITEQQKLDKDIMTSMLVAIQNFVSDSFQQGLSSFELESKKITMVAGSHLILVAVLEGTEPKVLREEMQSVVSKIEGLYAGIVESWDGNADPFKDVRQYLGPLFRLHTGLKMKKKKEAVKLKSGIEFYGGYVRLKLGVSNGLDTIITNVRLNLSYDTMSLRLSHIEPEYPIQGSTILLNDVKPGEKRSVAVYFDPIICQESSIDGFVTFTDGHYREGMADMKRRPVDIVCPIFYTKETINVAMLKRLIGELKYSDSKLYQITSVEGLKGAYKVANECVGAHDVKPIREFVNETPYEAESWFYGEVKGSNELLVIRVAAREQKQYLEIFVASRNLASMTGLLAEIGKEFGKVMHEWTEVGALKPLIDELLKGEIARTLSLLERTGEAEAGPADGEEKGPA